MTIESLSFDAFAAKYCERQDCEPIELRAALCAQIVKFAPIGFMLLECQQFDSSRFGELTILPYGPNNTFKEIPSHPISPRGLASDMSIVVARCDSAELGILPCPEVIE